jgi:hypothetical protein
MFNISGSRNFIILFVLLTGALILVSLQLISLKNAPPPSKDDIVDVVVGNQTLLVPKDFKDTLQRLNIRGIALVDSKRRLRPITTDGEPIDLCEPGTKANPGNRTCRLGITTSALSTELSGATTSCGRCKDEGGTLQSCHKKPGRTTNEKYPCPDDKPHTHGTCSDDC